MFDSDFRQSESVCERCTVPDRPISESYDLSYFLTPELFLEVKNFNCFWCPPENMPKQKSSYVYAKESSEICPFHIYHEILGQENPSLYISDKILRRFSENLNIDGANLDCGKKILQKSYIGKIQFTTRIMGRK